MGSRCWRVICFTRPRRGHARAGCPGSDFDARSVRCAPLGERGRAGWSDLWNVSRKPTGLSPGYQPRVELASRRAVHAGNAPRHRFAKFNVQSAKFKGRDSGAIRRTPELSCSEGGSLQKPIAPLFWLRSAVVRTDTSCDGTSTGNGSSSTALTSVKIVVFAPIPTRATAPRTW